MFDNYVLFIEEYNNKKYAIMPLCEEAFFEEAVETLKSYFHSLGLPLEIYVTDRVFKDFMLKTYGDEYLITSDRDQFDYLYDAEAMRTLAGKKLRKKRNHINFFMTEYEGRWRYEEIKSDKSHEICAFVKTWGETKGEEEGMLEDELAGVCILIEHMEELEVHVGVIYIDDELKAVTMGSIMNHGKEAVIHIEKADVEIRGLYQVINQEFLKNTLPDVTLVNREDDIGIEGLRKAKLSYYPIALIEKYNIMENTEKA
jgi:hypothetical protein